MARDRKASVFGTIPNENCHRTCKIFTWCIGASAFSGASRDAGSAGKVALRADTVSLRGAQFRWVYDSRFPTPACGGGCLHDCDVTLPGTMTSFAADPIFEERFSGVVLVLCSCYRLKTTRMAKKASRLDSPGEVNVVSALKSRRSTELPAVSVIRNGRLVQESTLLREQETAADSARADEIREFARDAEGWRFTIHGELQQTFGRKPHADYGLRRGIADRFSWSREADTAHTAAALRHRRSGVAARDSGVALRAHLGADFLCDRRGRKSPCEHEELSADLN